MTIEALLAKHNIAYVATRKGKYTTKCPGCGGDYLNVECKRDGVVWYCQACKEGGGEKYERKDNGNAKDGYDLGPIKAVFDYCNEKGERLFQVLRFEPPNSAKQFRQRTGPEQKKRSIKGVRIVPYRLPELIEAVGDDRPVFVVEGEKDVETLRARGVPATCNPMGAGKWWSDFNAFFRGADVIICGDNDQAGRDHVALVARNLRGVARRLCVLDLAKFWPDIEPSDDISDWFARGGGTVERLWEIVDKAPDYAPPTEQQPQSEQTQETPPQEEPPQEEPANETDVEITRLAKLSAIEYEQQRKTAAEILEVRASILDKLVEAERARLNPDAADGKQGHAIAFPEPEPWPEPVDGAALLDGIAKAIRDHVVMSDAARDAAALWVLHTYLIDCFLVSPRLGVRSPTKGCGKTLLLDVLGRLVLRPLPTANVTPAAIFRVVEGHQPTLLVDEADTFLRDHDELRGVLNGNRKGSQVLRTVGDDFEPRAFATYSACAIALIGQLPDTLHDRSVAIDLKRRLRSEYVHPFRPDRAGHLDVLARKAVHWAKDHADKIADADPKMPDGVINREADNWRPLLAIADEAGGEWPERAREAAGQAHIAAGGDDASRLELLLGDIRDAFVEKGTTTRDMFGAQQVVIASGDLVEALVAIEGRPWKEMGKARKPLTPNRLARMLKPLGITPQKVGPEDARVNGYIRAHFEEPFDRYLTPDAPDGGPQPDIRTEADEMGTSSDFKVDSPDPGCPVVNMQETQQRRASVRMSTLNGGTSEKAHAKSDDLPYRGLVVTVPDQGPDPLDDHGAPAKGAADTGGLGEDRRLELAAWREKWIAEGETPADVDDALRTTIREEIGDMCQVEIELERIKAAGV